MLIRTVLGLVIVVVALAVSGRRIAYLFRLITSGTAATPSRTDDVGRRVWGQLSEVIGQRRLLRWTVPGLAHAFTFWGFIILLFTIIEAGGNLFKREFHVPGIGEYAWLGFLEDFFATAVVVALVVFTILRRRNAPERRLRESRFYGSHMGPAWVILVMIALVVVTLWLYRGAQINTGHFPFGENHSGTWWTFASMIVAKIIHPLGRTANDVIETVFVLGQIAVIFGFLVLVVYSKHLHIFVAPLNVLFKRQPRALGALHDTPTIDIEEMSEDTTFGVGKVEDFSWKAMLDMATCTECGRCQSQCPAWNTGKPLSPKLLIMDLRDHLFAKGPVLLGGDGAATPEGADAQFEGAAEGHVHGVPESGFGRVPQPGQPQADRPLVGDEASGGVIDPDVLWSCTTCGACVEQCPVDIEHVDHILDMRRYQVMMESAFPSEAGVMLRNLENQGNPWGLPARKRLDWATDLSFELRVVEDTIPDDVEYLYWVGCAGASEDRSMKTARAFAEMLHVAGVEFAVLGEMEACNGDPARRIGNEYLFQEMAKANIETLDGVGAKKIVATCPHCFNTLANEYPALGGTYEVIHHTQLLTKLVEERKLIPVAPVDASVTYHDPCYLGRHNRIYTPPREVLGTIQGLRSEEMHRCKERGFCCGAGGARMWMEEHIGKRINVERVDEALGLDPDIIATSCPFCQIMLSDGVTARQQEGVAREGVEVLDVTEVLARSLVPAGAAAAAAEFPEGARPAGDGDPAGADNPQLSPETRDS